jgi:hypothetical protein
MMDINRQLHILTIGMCLAVPFFIFVGCDEDEPEPEPTDYRDEWVGTYFGHKWTSYWVMGQQTTYADGPDTLVITIVGDSAISVDGGPEMTIDSTGIFDQNQGASSHYRLEFRASDSLVVNSNNGGLGGGTTYLFRGKRN